MTQYYWLIGIVLFCWMTFENQKKTGLVRGGAPKGKTPTFVWIMCIALVYVAGFRHKVGTDYWTYMRMFDRYLSTPLSNIWTMDEPANLVLARVAGLFYRDYSAVFFAYALFTTYFCLRTIGRWANEICFGVLLFVLIGSFHGSFNAVRQSMAAAIVFAGHRYMLDKKLVKYIVVCYIASLFHVSALVMILPYFIVRRRLSASQLWLYIAIAVVCLLSYDRIFAIINNVKGGEQSGDYVARQVRLPRILVAWAPVVLMYIVKGKQRLPEHPDMDAERNFYFNLLLLNAAVMTASMNSAYIARVGINTSLYAAIALPMVVELAPKKDRKWFVIVIIVAYLAYWIIEVSNLHRFRWIWNR